MKEDLYSVITKDNETLHHLTKDDVVQIAKDEVDAISKDIQTKGFIAAKKYLETFEAIIKEPD